MGAMRNDLKKIYSYSDYLRWQDERIELIEGKPYLMTPAPSREHQRILLEMGRQFANFLVDKPCEVYLSPFDVRLHDEIDTNDENIYTVVQPDLVVVCDSNKLDDRGCIGAPDLVVEVISPSNANHDLNRKLSLYEKHGVKEYWVVIPHLQIVMVFYLENGEYGKPISYDRNQKIIPHCIKELEINLEDVFPEKDAR